jgi:hypothetical protein
MQRSRTQAIIDTPKVIPVVALANRHFPETVRATTWGRLKLKHFLKEIKQKILDL